MSKSPHHGASVIPMSAVRSRALSGRLRVPGDKSISHRALLIGALTVGRTEIEGMLEGEDVIATANAVRAMGASVTREGDGRWRVNGLGVGTLLPPRDVLDFGNAGTGSRLTMGVVAGHPFEDRPRLRLEAAGIAPRACAKALLQLVVEASYDQLCHVKACPAVPLIDITFE